jgi:hypothetical protein
VGGSFAIRKFGSRLFIVEAKQLDVKLSDHMPEAISQAIALSEVTGCDELFTALHP